MRKRTAAGPMPRELCTSHEREAAQCTTPRGSDAIHVSLKAYKEFRADPLSKGTFGPLAQDQQTTSLETQQAQPLKAPFQCPQCLRSFT